MHDGAAQPILAQLDDDIAPSLAAPSLAAPSRHFLTLAIEQLPAAIRLLEPLVAREFTLQPAIRDIWHDHVLYTGDEVTGLVDFGAMRIDTPAVDVARLLGSLAGDDVRRWQIGVAAYEGQRPLSPDERQAVPALDVAGTLLGGCNWVRWVFVERREFEQIGVVAARIAALHARLENFACRGPILDV
jgi:homoserine kinase type II